MEDKIKPLYTVLLLFEDVTREEPTVNVEQYVAYINRQAVEYLGMGYEEVYYSLLGLAKLGNNTTHAIVKSTVFHMINIVQGGRYGSKIFSK